MANVVNTQPSIDLSVPLHNQASNNISFHMTITNGHNYRAWHLELRSHEHCEANYLGRLEIIHFENIVGTRSSRRRISGVDSRSSTPGGGFGDTPYLNSLRIVVGTQSVLANPLHILQPCAVGYPR